jgi:hypothetical protein
MRIAVRQWKRPLLVAASIAIVVFLAVIVGPKFELSGVVSGVEFSPDLMKHRSFRYFEVLGIQVSPTQHRVWRSSIDEYLVSNGYAVEVSTESPRWRFVKGFRPRVRGWHGHAKYSCQALGCWNDDDQWIKWSIANPELAAVLWPQVVQWLREEKDSEVSYLLDYSRLEKATTPKLVMKCIQLTVDEANK